MAWNATERVYCNPEWRKTLLETPSGFALFGVSEDALKKADDIWVYFKDVDTAKNALFALGFVKFVDKSIAWDGGTRPSKDLIKLIQRFCNDKECLFVQNADFKDIVTKKLNVKCSYDHNVDDEVIWGIKNVLHGFIPEEKYNITREYRLPPSKGLQQCLQDYLIDVSEEMLNTDFISDVGLLRYLDITLEKVPKILREKFDEHVCKIGERIENDLKYAKVVAKILVPELSPTFDFNKMFPSDLALKVQRAEKCATRYRNEKLSMSDRELIMGSLSHLLVVPKQRDDIMIRVKLMEAQLRKTDVEILEDEYEFDISVRKHYSNLKLLPFRRILLETPSGFAIFGVRERVFARPKLIWVELSNAKQANEVVLALGFVKIDDKSIAWNRSDGPGPELSRIIQKLCTHENTLIVQDDALKSIIEEKLEVKCYTKCSNDDDGIGDLMWGLKYFLHEFIPQEADNLTENYYEPLSKGLQKALRSYDIVPQGPVDRNLIYILGYLEHLTHASKVVRIIFRKSFDQHVPLIGASIKDDENYAKVIARILVPECRHKFDFKSLSGDVAEKVADVERSLKESGKSVSLHDELAILLVLDFYETLNEKRQGCLHFLKSGGSEEELQGLEDKVLSDVENDTKLNEWIMLLWASLSDKSIFDDLDSMPDQLRDEVQVGVQGTEGGKKAVQKVTKTIGEIESNKEDSSDKNLNAIHNEEFSSDETESNQPSKHVHVLTDSSEKVSNVEELVESSIEKSVGADDNLLKLADHPAIFGGADNVDGQQATIGTQYSEAIEDGDPSNAAVSSEQLLEASVLPTVPEDGARLSSEIYESEIQINATGGGTSEQTNVVVSQQNGVTVTEEDGMTNTIGKSKGDEFGLSCQDNLQTEIGDSKSSTVLGEDAFDKNLNTATQRHQMMSNLSSNLTISETADLAISKGADNVDEHHHPIAEEDMEAISSAVGSAVGAKAVSVGSATNTTERVCSSAGRLDDNMQKNESSGTVGPSQERTEDTISKEMSDTETTDGTKGADQNDVATGRKHMCLQELLDNENLENENENVETENKASIKNMVLSLRTLSSRVLSFRRSSKDNVFRRSSKDNVSPVKKASRGGALKSKRRKMWSM